MKLKSWLGKSSSVGFLKKLNAILVYEDNTRKKAIEQLVNNVGIVYHCAAKVYWGSKQEFWTVNYEGTKCLLKACGKRSIRRFLHVSSIGVMGNIQDLPCQRKASV
jgi:nucleoside-diphosphate-sugar epimerase